MIVKGRLNSDLIKKKLAQFKLTREGLAAILGVTPQALTQWIGGKHPPKALALIAMAEYLSQIEPPVSVYDPAEPNLSLLIGKVSGIPAPLQAKPINWD